MFEFDQKLYIKGMGGVECFKTLLLIDFIKLESFEYD